MNTDASTAPRPALRRSADDRLLLGVCAGLARTLGVRTLHVRVGAVLFSAIAAPLLFLAYAAIALIVPRDDGRVLLGGSPGDRREQLLGWASVALAGVLLLAAGIEPEGLVWPALSGGGIVLAALGVIGLAVREGRRVAAPAVPGARPPGTPPAAAAPAESAPTAPLPVPVSRPARPAESEPEPEPDSTLRMHPPTIQHARPAAPPRRSGRRTAVLVTGVALLVLAAIATAGVVAGAAIGGIGDTTKRPATLADLDSEYRLGVGAMDIDLRELTLPRGATDVQARVGAGSLTVFVPSGVRVESVGATELTGVERVNRAARAAQLRERRAVRAARRAGRGRGRRAGPTRPAPVRTPRTVRIDADVSLGSASVIATGD